MAGTAAEQTRGGRRPARPDTLRYWYAGLLIDVLHIPLVIALVMLGATWLSGTVYATIISAVVIAQVAVLGCPVLAFTGWLKRKHDPGYETHWSFTYWLYQRYGRAVGFVVFAFFLLAALGVRLLW